MRAESTNGRRWLAVVVALASVWWMGGVARAQNYIGFRAFGAVAPEQVRGVRFDFTIANQTYYGSVALSGGESGLVPSAVAAELADAINIQAQLAGLTVPVARLDDDDNTIIRMTDVLTNSVSIDSGSDTGLVKLRSVPPPEIRTALYVPPTLPALRRSGFVYFTGQESKLDFSVPLPFNTTPTDFRVRLLDALIAQGYSADLLPDGSVSFAAPGFSAVEVGFDVPEWSAELGVLPEPGWGLLGLVGAVWVLGRRRVGG